MRIDVKKFLFLGPEAGRAQFFAEAQKEGIIQFIDGLSKKRSEYPDALPRFLQALKILRERPVVDQIEPDELTKAPQMVEEILELHEKQERLEEAMRTLRLEISRVAVFGDFSLDDIAYIERKGHRNIQFFAAKGQTLEKMEELEGLIYIGFEHGLYHFMAIHAGTQPYPGMLEMKIDHPVGELRKQLLEKQEQLLQVEQRLKSLAAYSAFLRQALIHILDQHNYHEALTFPKTTIEGRLFAVTGWVPVNKLDVLHRLASRLGVYADEIAIEAQDSIPTYLENQGWGRIGEDLVRFYDTPSPTDKDPSTWVLVFFSIFFAIIVGDAGYGILFLLLALFLRFKFPHARGVAKRLLDLSTLLAITCISWGLLTNAFFSLPIDLHSPLRHLSLISWLGQEKAHYHVTHQTPTYQQWVTTYPKAAQATSGQELLMYSAVEKEGRMTYPLLSELTDGILVDLILLLGIVHLILSMGRNLRANFAGFGWILFLIGAYFYVPSFLDAITLTQYLGGVAPEKAEQAGRTLVFIGLGLAVSLSLIQNRLFGLLEITNVLQVCGDVLSYLRLYALGLAGAMVATTVNDLAASLPIVFAVLILIIGHLVNIALCIMGGVIHGLRLNWLEWFHYSFQGDGRPFKPLRKIEVD